VTGYVSYELWVDNITTGAKEVLTNVNGITTTSYQTTLPLENGDFKVWVRGYDRDGNVSQWSGPADFTCYRRCREWLRPCRSSFRNANGSRKPSTGLRWYRSIQLRNHREANFRSRTSPVVLNRTGITGTTFTAPTVIYVGNVSLVDSWTRMLMASDSRGASHKQFFVQNSTEETAPT
jgi:hypothetical protein